MTHPRKASIEVDGDAGAARGRFTPAVAMAAPHPPAAAVAATAQAPASAPTAAAAAQAPASAPAAAAAAPAAGAAGVPGEGRPAATAATTTTITAAGQCLRRGRDGDAAVTRLNLSLPRHRRFQLRVLLLLLQKHRQAGQRR